jgi:hypothetical protein
VRRFGCVLALLAAAAGAEETVPANGIETWACTSRDGADKRELEIDHASRRIVMRSGETTREGRFTLETSHLVAVFAENGGGGAEELTLGLASGRIYTKLRLADGRATPAYIGHCRRRSEST